MKIEMPVTSQYVTSISSRCFEAAGGNQGMATATAVATTAARMAITVSRTIWPFRTRVSLLDRRTPFLPVGRAKNHRREGSAIGRKARYLGRDQGQAARPTPADGGDVDSWTHTAVYHQKSKR